MKITSKTEVGTKWEVEVLISMTSKIEITEEIKEGNRVKENTKN